MADRLRERRLPEHHAADAACEEFAMTETWPPIRTDSIVAQVHLRVHTAIQLCRSRVDRRLPQATTRRQLLRSVLLDHWHELMREVSGQSVQDAKAAPPEEEAQKSLWAGAVGSGFNVTVGE